MLGAKRSIAPAGVQTLSPPKFSQHFSVTSQNASEIQLSVCSTFIGDGQDPGRRSKNRLEIVKYILVAVKWVDLSQIFGCLVS